MYATSKADNNILVEDDVDDRRFPGEKLSKKVRTDSTHLVVPELNNLLDHKLDWAHEH
jgi:hypothetical protein